MKRVQKKEEKYYKKKKCQLVCKKREVKALLVRETALQLYKEELNIEEKEILKKGWLGAKQCQ